MYKKSNYKKIALAITILILATMACIVIENGDDDGGSPPPPPIDEPEKEKPPQPPPRTSVDYTIWVTTGDIDKGGTDADVWIELFGTNGSSGEIYLDTSGYDDFEKGDITPYGHTLSNLGEIEQVCIWHDNSGDGSGWYLESVMVENDEGRSWFFPFNQWLADDEPPGQLKACR